MWKSISLYVKSNNIQLIEAESGKMVTSGLGVGEMGRYQSQVQSFSYKKSKFQGSHVQHGDDSEQQGTVFVKVVTRLGL